MEARIRLPPKLVPVFAPPRGSVQYRWAKGGRGSGKSFSFAKMAAVWGYVEPLRILCARELQVSIKESFHAEVKNAIASEPWLEAAYDVGESYIRNKINGTEFIFRGLRHNVQNIKSMAQIDLTIVEEAEDVPEESWRDVEPSVLRRDRSEIWVLWNPRKDGSPVDNRFLKSPPANAIGATMNYMDNPWFPAGLESLRKRDLEILDPYMYAHIWDGQYLSITDALVFKGKFRISDFQAAPGWDGPYYGADWGFSTDPTVLIRCWVHDHTLYIDYESHGYHVELDDLHTLFDKVPDSRRYTIRADSSRPETISHVNRSPPKDGKSFRVESVEKWKGSVEDGIEVIRSFKEVVIHPRCTNTAEEFRLYSYKIDRLTQDVLTDIVDRHNHCIDALRYALAPFIKRTGWGMFDVPRR